MLTGGVTAAAWLAETLAAWRRPGRRRRAARRRPPTAAPAALISDLIDHLGAIRGHCELTRLEHPQDAALTRHMDLAMASCDEAAALIRGPSAVHQDRR